jgi:hypothetical protein
MKQFSISIPALWEARERLSTTNSGRELDGESGVSRGGGGEFERGDEVRRCRCMMLFCKWRLLGGMFY